MMDYGDMGTYGWIWMTLVMGFWIAVAVLVGWMAIRKGDARPPTTNAEEILRRRYASGEINEIDFESARQTLRRS